MHARLRVTSHEGRSVTTIVEHTRELYEQDELPEELRWIDDLSPRHQRLFYGELQWRWSQYCITEDAGGLAEFFDDWKATAEADGNHEHSAFLLGEHDDDHYEEWQARAVG